MNREEAVQIIEKFIEDGGSLFIDGCKGDMPDSDLINIAKDCRKLTELNKEEGR